MVIVKEEMVDVGLHSIEMEVALFDCDRFGSEIEPKRTLTQILIEPTCSIRFDSVD